MSEYSVVEEKVRRVCDVANQGKSDLEAIKDEAERIGYDNTDIPTSEYYKFIFDILPSMFGNRVTYSRMFENSPIKALPFLPFEKLVGNLSLYNFAMNCPNLEYLPTYDYSRVEDCQSVYRECPKLKYISIMNTGISTMFSYAFLSCSNLKTIESIDMSSVTNDNNVNLTFHGCNRLENIRFVGTISVRLVVSSCPLTVESLMSIINALADLTGQEAKTITLGSTNISKLTEEQLQIIKDKNWNYK